MTPPAGHRGARITAWCLVWLVLGLFSAEVLLRESVPWRATSLESRLLLKPTDRIGHNGFELQRIRNEYPKKHDEVVVLVGGSASLLAVNSDRSVSRRLSGRLGRSARFASLCATYQVFADDAKIVRALSTFGGTVLLSVEPARFSKTARQQRSYRDRRNRPVRKYFYLSNPPRVNRILAAHGAPASLNDRFLLLRTVRGLGPVLKLRLQEAIARRGMPPRLRYRRVGPKDDPPASPAKIAKVHKWLGRTAKGFRRWRGMNRELLEAAISIAQHNGNRVILLDLPASPVFADEVAAFSPAYDEMIRDVVRRHRTGYLDLRQAAPWAADDFRDLHHLRRSGRPKFVRALVDGLSTRLGRPRRHRGEGRP